ncbi:aftiphilin-like isoform X2 [Eriocheir sinensis]|uniref:aftiphilin-like isoform X2 n=1 Tax=Eriocheir sinensis TaxID=95602 RepID=UPI0021C8C2DD|nr:aftiphilin-like isoform X2 [Eriocheir sinensis]
MAFQMIPPRLSSSPPPLDSLPSVACPGVDEDDEFDHFSSHNASFDITVAQARLRAPCTADKASSLRLPSTGSQQRALGLSDKLPPTPESSPSKFPGLRLGSAIDKGLSEGLEGTLEDSISQDSGVDSSNHPHEFSPQPQGDEHPCSREDLISGDVRADREYSDNEQNGVDDFGDFQGGGVAGVETSGAKECLDGFSGTISQDKIDGQISSQLLSQESENSKCEESNPVRHRTNCSPPPLECVAESTVVEDGFPSSFVPPNDAADFGDFASHEATFDPSSDTHHLNDTSLHSHDLQPGAKATVLESDNGEIASSDAQQVSYAERLQDTSPEEEDLVCKPDRDARSGVKGVSDCEHLGENFASPPKETLSPLSDERTERGAADGMATSSRDVGESSGESTTRVSDRGIGEARTEDTARLENISPSPSGIESAVLESEWPVEGSDRMGEGSEQEVEPSNDADATEHFGVVCGSDEESNFGDFNQASGDEDDLDFADLRKQVESSSFEDFGDFSSGFAENNDGGVGSAERSGNDKNTENKAEFDDFGDFTASADTEDKAEFGDFGDFTASADTEEKAEFGDFGDFTASADTEDKAEFGDFGDFEGHTKEREVDDNVPQDFEDDFGDFSAPKSSEELQGSTTGGVVEEAQFPPSDDGVEKKSLVLQKLESLVAKWIPSAPMPPQEESCPVPLLHQAIESDAFVWRQLENLESSAALRLSWSSTQAHTYFLSSVNVDARNILFGQKWSSSVPLFAQTLSFSPLTPAKSTEGGGTGGSAGVALSAATKELPPDTSATATIKHGQHKKKFVHDPSSTHRADKGSEEQIPPAKFDWTSSGLTNPLEGPAYSSSLFGLDLLLANTKIGKGATNALLASLEQEFLSEGGEKASNGRVVKSPPTPSPLVQQILGGGMSKVPTPATPLQSLAPEVRQVVTQLPDLSFMRSRVLMFPIRGEQ